MNSYTEALIWLFNAIIGLTGFHLARKPYIMMGEGKLMIRHVLIKQKEYMLSGLKMINYTEKLIELSYDSNEVSKKIKVYLGQIDKSDIEQFKKDINDELNIQFNTLTWD